MIKLKELLTESDWVKSLDRWPPNKDLVKIKTDLGKEFTGYYDPKGGWFTEDGRKLIGVVKWKPLK